MRKVGFAAGALLLALACGGTKKQPEMPQGGGEVAEIEGKIAANCPADKVGALPTNTPEQKAELSDLIAKVLGKAITKADFVSQLVAKNPGSETAVQCAADQIPDATTPEAPPPG